MNEDDGFPIPTESDGYVMSTVNKNISVFLNVPRVKADPETIREKMERHTVSTLFIDLTHVSSLLRF